MKIGTIGTIIMKIQTKLKKNLKFKIMKIIKSFLLIGILITFTLQSCDKNNSVAPELPPEASFVIDFSDFNSNKFAPDVTNENWKHAAGNVFVWNDIITVDLAVPIASYAEAIVRQKAVYQGDGQWLWEFSFTNKINNITHSAKLFGTTQESSIYWEMFISKEGEYTDFKWYTGTSMLDKSKVSWTLYNKPGNASELLSIEYINTSESTGNITYTNIIPENSDNGAYIKYGNDYETDLNAYYHIFNKGQDNLTEIEWSQTTKNGRVRDSLKFKNIEWHCWDVNLEDIDCNN